MQRRHRCRAEAPDTWQTHRPKSVGVYGMLESQSRAQGGGCESAEKSQLREIVEVNACCLMQASVCHTQSTPSPTRLKVAHSSNFARANA